MMQKEVFACFCRVPTVSMLEVNLNLFIFFGSQLVWNVELPKNSLANINVLVDIFLIIFSSAHQILKFNSVYSIFF